MWQLRESDTATGGFPFAITDAEDVLAWCAREDDAAFIVRKRGSSSRDGDRWSQIVTHGSGPPT